MWRQLGVILLTDYYKLAFGQRQVVINTTSATITFDCS